MPDSARIDHDESLEALFAQPGDAGKRTVMMLLEDFWDYNDQDWRALQEQVHRIAAGDKEAFLPFPIIEIAATLHAIWMWGYEVGKKAGKT
jgi:hypothetical protein